MVLLSRAFVSRNSNELFKAKAFLKDFEELK